MQRYFTIFVICTIIAVGCAARTPVAPDSYASAPQTSQKAGSLSNGNHHLWGEFTWYISANHDRIDVVPKRQARVHLNALKFLESNCADCLKITNIKNNGDNTIDVTVRIKHPFPSNPEYTGFDVKGIVMFSGSHKLLWISHKIYPFMDLVALSWREMGDPELLNPDGYTPRWNPAWESGSDLPMFNYWPGKHSNGTPTANINGYLNFYTDEERHMFRNNGTVENTYHIWLPPGPLTVGYAVDACWEPPTVKPVTDPVADFPISANQSEPYHLNLVINNNQPITKLPCCGNGVDCETLWLEMKQWRGHVPDRATIHPGMLPLESPELHGSCPSDPTLTIVDTIGLTDKPNGFYQGIFCAYWLDVDLPDDPVDQDSVAYDVFEYTMNHN